MNKSPENNVKGRNGKTGARVEHSAGGVVFRRTRRGILVGLIMDSYRKWTFPKGHVDKGEGLVAAALRETREEMGLVGLRSIKPLGTTLINFKDRFVRPGTTIHKYIAYFLMETAPGEKGAAENKKQGERVRAIRWVPVQKLARSVSYKNLAPVVKAATAYLDRTDRRGTNGR